MGWEDEDEDRGGGYSTSDFQEDDNSRSSGGSSGGFNDSDRDEDRGGYGAWGQTGVTAEEERSGPNPGNQTKSYGGGGGDDGFTRDEYDPSQGPSGFERWMDPRRKNALRDIMKYAGMAASVVPGFNALAPALKAYNTGMTAWGAASNPEGFARDKLADLVGSGVQGATSQMNPLVSRIIGKAAGTLQQDIREGPGALGDNRGSSFDLGGGSDDGSGRPVISREQLVTMPNITQAVMRWTDG